MFNSKKPTEQVTEKVPSKFPIKGIAIGIGVLVGISHIGLLGYVLRPQESIQQPPAFNLPQGPYSSYKIKVGKVFFAHPLQCQFTQIFNIALNSRPSFGRFRCWLLFLLGFDVFRCKGTRGFIILKGWSQREGYAGIALCHIILVRTRSQVTAGI